MIRVDGQNFSINQLNHFRNLANPTADIQVNITQFGLKKNKKKAIASLDNSNKLKQNLEQYRKKLNKINKVEPFPNSRQCTADI